MAVDKECMHLQPLADNIKVIRINDSINFWGEMENGSNINLKHKHGFQGEEFCLRSNFQLQN